MGRTPRWLKLKNERGNNMAKEVTLDEAYALWEEGIAIYDIRDMDSFNQAHIPGAIPLTEESYHQVVKNDESCLICCYHGVSSLGIIDRLRSQGAQKAKSLIGGMEGWKEKFPQSVQKGQVN